VATDVAEQYRRLPPRSIVAEFQYQGTSHMDFVWDREGPHHGDLVGVPRIGRAMSGGRGGVDRSTPPRGSDVHGTH